MRTNARLHNHHRCLKFKMKPTGLALGVPPWWKNLNALTAVCATKHRDMHKESSGIYYVHFLYNIWVILSRYFCDTRVIPGWYSVGYLVNCDLVNLSRLLVILTSLPAYAAWQSCAVLTPERPWPWRHRPGSVLGKRSSNFNVHRDCRWGRNLSFESEYSMSMAGISRQVFPSFMQDFLNRSTSSQVHCRERKVVTNSVSWETVAVATVSGSLKLSLSIG